MIAPETVYGYIRVSTNEQKLSPDAQARAIRDYCRLYELGEPAVLSDIGCSGKDVAGRPAMVQLLDAIEAGSARAVVCYKLDRLFRSARDAFAGFELMQAHGCDLHSVQEHIDTSTASGRLVQGVLLLLAQWEREQTGERTSFALQSKKRAAGGESINGRAPYGWRWETRGTGEPKVLVVDAHEQENVSAMRQARKAGHRSREIAAHLNASGRRMRSGEHWTERQVRRVLASMAKEGTECRLPSFDQVDAE